MEFLKRLSTSSTTSNTSSPSRTSTQSSSSIGFLSKFRACTLSTAKPSSSGLPDPQVADQLCAVQRDYEARCVAREHAARERVAKMKLMLGPPTGSSISSNSTTESAGLVSDTHLTSNSAPQNDVAMGQVNAIIDLYLEIDLVPEPDIYIGDSRLVDEYINANPLSKPTSDLGRASSVNADSETISISSLYSNHGGTKSYMAAAPAENPLSATVIAEIVTDKKARPFTSADMRPPSRCSELKQGLWRGYYSNARNSRATESALERTKTLCPPPTEDILFVSLTPIVDTSSIKASVHKPAVCVMCMRILVPSRDPDRKRLAWMIHSGARSDAHFLHVECLRTARSVWGHEHGPCACVKCDAFRGVVQGVVDKEFQSRVMRMEHLAFGTLY